MSWFGDAIDWYHDNGLIPGIWKGITGQQSNEKINEENIEYQKERNAIEDARYEEETAYNRAFAENEREYSRNLQQEIWNREDTAISRQAEDLARLGINPLSQNMQGLGSGAVVGQSTEPTTSARGGQALNKQLTGVNATGALLGLADTLDGIQTGKYQRDALALQNDKQYLENLKIAHDLNIDYKGYMPDRMNKSSYRKSHIDFFDDNDNVSLFDKPEWNSSGGTYLKSKNFENRNLNFKMNNDLYDFDNNWLNNLRLAGSDDVYGYAEKAITKAANLFDKASSKIFDNYNEKYNPLNYLLQLFK